MLTNETGGFIFQCLGALALLTFVWTLIRQARVRRWPMAAGEILESSVIRDADRNAEPRIRYRYTVGGTDYESDHIHPSGRAATTTGGHAHEMTDKYPGGRRVAVRYNPSNPSDSALETALPLWVPVLQLVAGVVFFLMGEFFSGLL